MKVVLITQSLFWNKMVVYHAQNNIVVFSNIQRLKNYVLSCNLLIYFFSNVTTRLITFKLWISNKLVSLLYLCQGDALCYKRNQTTLYPLNVHIVNTIIIVKQQLQSTLSFPKRSSVGRPWCCSLHYES